MAASQAEIENLRLQNSEMQQEVESCKNREAELLEFTQKLTEKNVQLQSQFLTIEARAQQLDIEHSSCTVRLVLVYKIVYSYTFRNHKKQLYICEKI